MRIGCLQFAPQVGDINNNLNRADAVLSKAKDLEDLDLLVLPELAFTGYNFHSLSHITPFLEPSGSGISSLWARTTALKLNCNVVVGYPEKVDVAPKWPTSPEFYNSAIIVGKDGETIANYRKSFLYAVDETWALEGQDGFFADEVDDLGSTALGICMDINPYKFEAPWHAFEFAYHVLDVQANLVIITMAWVTREDPSVFTQQPQEPDLETLQYWMQRLEPVIRSGNDDEIIVVCCNRTGIEEDCVYAGTTAVMGIKQGAVRVYGILGRGDKDVLVVDTSKRPFANLVLEEAAGQVPAAADGALSTLPSAQSSGSTSAAEPSALVSEESREPAPSSASPAPSEGNDDLWEQSSVAASAGSSSRSVRSQTWLNPRRLSVPKLSLQVPAAASEGGSTENAKKPENAAKPPAGSPIDIPTPSAPSPTPSSLRPVVPSSEEKVPLPPSSHHTAYPSSINTAGGGSLVKVKHAAMPMTPLTPAPRAGARGRAGAPTPIFEASPSPPNDASLGLLASARTHRGKERSLSLDAISASTDRKKAAHPPRCTSGMAKTQKQTALQAEAAEAHRDFRQLLIHTAQQPAKLPPVPPRPASTKSRNASRSERTATADELGGRSTSRARMLIPIVAGPGILSEQQQTETQKPAVRRADSAVYFRPDANFSSRPSSHRRQPSEASQVPRQSTGSFPATNALSSRSAASAAAVRAVSRGRQPFPKVDPTNGASGAASSTSTPNAPPTTANRSKSATSLSSTSWLVGSPPLPSASGMGSVGALQRPINADDEIIAVINRISQACPVHNSSRMSSAPPAPETNLGIPSLPSPPLLETVPAPEPEPASPPMPVSTAEDDSHTIYEVILPPHIRELVESLSNSMDAPRQTSRRGRAAAAPRFNPPTPTAMQFSINDAGEASEASASNKTVDAVAE